MRSRTGGAALSRIAGLTEAVAPTSSSAHPNQKAAAATPSPTRPATRLPIASPAMKLAHTLLAVYTVTPNTHPSTRSQQHLINERACARQEEKNGQMISTRCGLERMIRSSMASSTILECATDNLANRYG